MFRSRVLLCAAALSCCAFVVLPGAASAQHRHGGHGHAHGGHGHAHSGHGHAHGGHGHAHYGGYYGGHGHAHYGYYPRGHYHGYYPYGGYSYSRYPGYGYVSSGYPYYGYTANYYPSVVATAQPAYPPPTAAPAAAMSTARIQVQLPDADAQVWIEGNGTSSRGMTRVYESPVLDSGKVFTYTMRASWTRDGRAVTEERQVNVTAGRTSVVDFTQPPAAEKIAPPNSPAGAAPAEGAPKAPGGS